MESCFSVESQFANLQGKQVVTEPEFQIFEVKLQSATNPMEINLVQAIGRFEKPRVWEIGIPP